MHGVQSVSISVMQKTCSIQGRHGVCITSAMQYEVCTKCTGVCIVKVMLRVANSGKLLAPDIDASSARMALASATDRPCSQLLLTETAEGLVG